MDSAREPLVFGRTIRRLRRDRDLSQQALAGAAGIGAKHVSEIERGNREPRLTTITKLAKGLGLTPVELMGSFAEQLDAAGERA
jgi:transcriptional regulator with XRE-family HTH domain